MNTTLKLLRLLSTPKVAFVLLSATLLFLALQTANYIANIRAKDTYLKDFYRQAAVTEQHSRELTFPNFIIQAPVDGSRPAWEGRDAGGWRIQYCSGAGGYHNNVTGKTIDNARTCQKGTNRFYWLPTLDSQTVDQKIAAMQELGWSLTDTDSPDNTQLVKADLFEQQESDRGFTFTRSDGTYASLLFWNRQGHDASYSGQDWCVYGPGCNELKKADTIHQYFMSVSIYAYKGYE